MWVPIILEVRVCAYFYILKLSLLLFCCVCSHWCMLEEELQHFSNPHGLAAHSPGSPTCEQEHDK